MDHRRIRTFPRAEYLHAPLPPGVPYEQQQFYALMSEHGILDVTPESQAALAARIRANIACTSP